MHILFLTQVLPYPLDAGPKVRAYFVLRYLAQFHRVTLVSFVRQSDTPENIAHLQQFCANVHTWCAALSLDSLLSWRVTGFPLWRAN